MDADEDEIQEVDGDTWNYLDGTPAKKPDTELGTGFIEKTISDVASLLNPFSWFRRKPRPPLVQQRRRNGLNNRVTRKIEPPEVISQPNYPAKRLRVSDVEFGQIRLDECIQDPPKNGMPPNILFSSDERPTKVSKADYITDDEDSDVEMTTSSVIRQRNTFATKPTTDFSIPIRRPPLASTSTPRSPLMEQKKYLEQQLPSPSVSRTPNLLPAVSAIKSSARHPLATHVKSIAQSPASSSLQSSRKRGFGEVDQEQSPKINYPNFPKSTGRNSFGVSNSNISRFGLLARPASDASNPKIVPYHSIKRYAGSLNLASASDISGLKKLGEPLKAQQSNQAPSPKTSLGIRLPDFKFIVPNTTAAVDGDSQFQFSPLAVVPTGALANALNSTVDKIIQESKKASPVKTCRTCGIHILKSAGEECDVCERMTLEPRQTKGTSSNGKTICDQVEKETTTNQEVEIIEQESWRCSLCDKSNKIGNPQCERCGANKLTTKKRLWSSKKERSESPVSVNRGQEELTQKEQPSPLAPVIATSQPASDIPSGFVDIWKKPTGWSCPDCMCQNKAEQEACPACGAAKPGSAPKAKQALPLFSFGTPQPLVTTSASLEQPRVPLPSIPSGGFSFGASQPPVSTTASSIPALSFGGFKPITSTPAPAMSQPSSFFGSVGTAVVTTNGPLIASEPATTTANMVPAPVVPSFGVKDSADVFNRLTKKPVVESNAPPTASFPTFPIPSSTGSSNTPSTFGGFANGTLGLRTTATAAAPVITSTAPSLDSLFSKSSTLNNLPAPGFNFGAPATSSTGGLFSFGATSQSPFSGFGTAASIATTTTVQPTSTLTIGTTAPSLFGTLSTNGPVFGSGGATTWGTQPVQNGHATQPVVPFGSQGLPGIAATGFGAALQGPQDGTFGAGALAPPSTRKITRGKRHILHR